MSGCYKLSISATMLLVELISVVALVSSSNGKDLSGGGVENFQRSRGTPGEPLENSVTSKLTYSSVTYSRDWIDRGLDIVYGLVGRGVPTNKPYADGERITFVVAAVILSILLATCCCCCCCCLCCRSCCPTREGQLPANMIYDWSQKKEEEEAGPSTGMNV